MHRPVLTLASTIFLERGDDVLRMLPSESGDMVGRIDIGIALDSMASHAGGSFLLADIRIALRMSGHHRQ
jgi:hypothetical protein